MIGQQILHYKIIEKLGEGGMGVVYKAEDTKLKRDVAIKFLPRQIATSEEERKRFKIEAQVAAALNHPNIATIHTIEDVDDDTFIVMEYLDGQELSNIIEAHRATPLPLEKILNIALQIAEGLQAAHKKGIVHRDIKSANTMLTENDQVKIMDFGLAKLTGQKKLTKSGAIMGSVAYISPEQASGKEVDHRTDIWSLGVVLYEMLTGQLPFKGEHEQTVIYSILHEDPAPLGNLRQDLPTYIQLIINKILEKNRTSRYQTIQEFSRDVKEQYASVTTSAVHQKSIVVLPFEDISPDKNNGYFSDGLTEEIITDLSKIHTLRVISRTSAMMLKSTKKDIRTIARELNVQYALEGSVRKAGNNLRITAQLIDARVDTHLWAEKYKGTEKDVFDIQEEVSLSIVEALTLELTPEEKERIAERPIENVHAYECYLRARQELWSMTANSLDHAIQHLKNGLNIVGDNELLLATMGKIYLQYLALGIRPDPRYLDEAVKCVKRVFELNPDSSPAYVVRGMLHYFKKKDLQEAVRDLKRALETDPNEPDALSWITLMYLTSGKEVTAKPLIRKLLDIDPLTPISHNWPGLMALMEGRLDDAAESHGKMHQMDPRNPFLRLIYAMVLSRAQRLNEADLLLDQIIKDTPYTPFARQALFLKYALQGDKRKAMESVTPELKNESQRDEYLSWYTASSYALINEKEEALYWLENATRLGFINYPFLSKFDPFLENIRSEERFKQLMDKVKTAWNRFEV